MSGYCSLYLCMLEVHEPTKSYLRREVCTPWISYGTQRRTRNVRGARKVLTVEKWILGCTLPIEILEPYAKEKYHIPQTIYFRRCEYMWLLISFRGHIIPRVHWINIGIKCCLFKPLTYLSVIRFQDGSQLTMGSFIKAYKKCMHCLRQLDYYSFVGILLHIRFMT